MHLSEYKRIEKYEALHFWYRAMEESSLEILDRYLGIKRELKILDTGCGTGGMTRKLSRFGAVIGVDINKYALSYARKKGLHVRKADVCRLPYPPSYFDIVTSFDVLYHKGVTDDRLAIKEIFRVLKPGGFVLIRVPALEILRGAHDITVETRHRYELHELKKKLENAGFSVRTIAYSNMILSIPLFFKRAHERIFCRNRRGSDTAELPKLLNDLFYWILRNELKLMGSLTLPFGSSIIAIALKPS